MVKNFDLDESYWLNDNTSMLIYLFVYIQSSTSLEEE